MKNFFTLTVVGVFCLTILTIPAAVQASKYKVLAVMSYEQDNPWCEEIKEGIDFVLSDSSELTYFYMDTKNNLEGGQQKAQEAYGLLEKLQPDGVITVDDNAQWMFTVPFLKDKTAVPVFFCGVNADAGKYGYPASNVSGILERGHIREGIAFTKQLYPSLKTVLVLSKESPSGKALQKQIESEADSYVAKISDIKLVKSVKELVALEDEFKEASALFIDSLEGIVDENGVSLTNQKLIYLLSQMFPGPIIGANQYHVEQGALCAVVKTGQEQGSTAASMLLEAMRGRPVSDIPITQNYKGKRVINVTVMEELKIVPRQIILLGTELLKTKE